MFFHKICVYLLLYSAKKTLKYIIIHSKYIKTYEYTPNIYSIGLGVDFDRIGS